jgi:hypothetical protein
MTVAVRLELLWALRVLSSGLDANPGPTEEIYRTCLKGQECSLVSEYFLFAYSESPPC